MNHLINLIAVSAFVAALSLLLGLLTDCGLIKAADREAFAANTVMLFGIASLICCILIFYTFAVVKFAS